MDGTATAYLVLGLMIVSLGQVAAAVTVPFKGRRQHRSPDVAEDMAAAFGPSAADGDEWLHLQNNEISAAPIVDYAPPTDMDYYANAYS